MANFRAEPIVIREIPELGLTVSQSGNQADVNGRPAVVTTAREILGNPIHYLRTALPTIMPRMESGEIAALVHWQLKGKPGHILITAEQWQLGAAERQRYEIWAANIVAARAAEQDRERQDDLVNNEGAEGYNPYRQGDEPTYARAPRRDRDYPEGS